MTFRVVTVPVQLGRNFDSMILGARMAVADVIRNEARTMLQAGQGAGIDNVAIGQRMVMQYAAAAQASRFLRTFPGATARWCFQVEQDGPALASEQYPAPQPNSVGNYGPGWLTVMPNRVLIVNAGGVRASGIFGEDDNILPHEIRETRIFRTLGNDGTPSYAVQIIMSSDTGSRDQVTDPVGSEPELWREDA